MQVGSMLKTPRKPIWVTYINRNYGLMFCTNPELVGNWRSEHQFILHYYTGLPSQTTDVKLNVGESLVLLKVPVLKLAYKMANLITEHKHLLPVTRLI